MVNAAKHAGGAVSVYVEVDDGRVTVLFATGARVRRRGSATGSQRNRRVDDRADAAGGRDL